MAKINSIKICSSELSAPYEKVAREKLKAKPGEEHLKIQYQNQDDVLNAIDSLPKAPKSVLFTHNVFRSGFSDSIVTQRIDVKNRNNFSFKTTESYFLDGCKKFFVTRNSKKNTYLQNLKPKSNKDESAKEVIKEIIKSGVQLNDIPNCGRTNFGNEIKTFDVII